MPEEATTIVPPAPNITGVVSETVAMELKLRDLKDKYTREWKRALDANKIDEAEYTRQVTNYVLVVKGIYSQARLENVEVSDSGPLTHELVFDRAYTQFTGRKFGEAPPELEPTLPPGTQKIPSRVTEPAGTVAAGEESLIGDYPLHDNDTWIAVRKETLRRHKTPSSGVGDNIISDIISRATRG